MFLNRDWAVVTRRVTVQGNSAEVTDLAGLAGFRCALSHPDSVPSGTSSPRDYASGKLWYSHREYLAPADGLLNAGDRISINGDEWELLTGSRPRYAGRSVKGMQALVQRTSVLYPLGAQVTEQGGDPVVLPLLPIALWAPSEHHESRGSYEDFECEAPIEADGVVGANKWLKVGDQTYRVISASTDYVGPRVEMRVRRAGG